MKKLLIKSAVFLLTTKYIKYILQSASSKLKLVVKNMFGQGWQDTNVQPGRETSGLDKVGVCPHFELLSAAAELLGIDASSEEHFCGCDGVTVNNIGPFSGRQGIDCKPKAFCVWIAIRLKIIIDKANDGVQNLDLSDCFNKLKVLHDQKGEKADQEFKDELQKLSDARQLRAYLATLVSNAPMIGDPARARSPEESMLYASQLLQSIIESVTGDNLDWASVMGNTHCPQAPKPDFIGMQS